MSKRRFVWVACVLCMLAVAVVACAHQIMSYCKIVALDVGTVNDFSGNLVGNVGGEASKSHFLAGSGFYNNAGTLTLLDDATRTPQNVSSIAANGTYLSRLTLATTGDKTNWITASPSDELAVLGYQPSISAVAASTVDIGGYAPLIARVDGSTAKSANSLINNDLSVALASNILTITHPPSDAADVPVVSPAMGAGPGDPVVLAAQQSSTTTTDIYALSDINGRLSYNGSAWVFYTSCQNCGFGTSGPIAGGTIQVTHNTVPGIASRNNVMLTPHQAVYRVAVMTESNGYFEIAFINSAGTVITTPDTDMVVNFRRNALAQDQFYASTDAQVNIRKGPMPVSSANLQNVSGGEVFVAESMDY